MHLTPTYTECYHDNNAYAGSKLNRSYSAVGCTVQTFKYECFNLYFVTNLQPWKNKNLEAQGCALHYTLYLVSGMLMMSHTGFATTLKSFSFMRLVFMSLVQTRTYNSKIYGMDSYRQDLSSQIKFHENLSLFLTAPLVWSQTFTILKQTHQNTWRGLIPWISSFKFFWHQMLEVNIFNKVSHEFLQALVNSQHTCIKNCISVRPCKSTDLQ